MLGPFTFTFTLESEEFENFKKVADLYQGTPPIIKIYLVLVAARMDWGDNDDSYLPFKAVQRGNDQGGTVQS